MTIGRFVNKGGDALQCTLLGDDELLVLCLCKVRQSNVKKVYGDDCVLIGAKGLDRGFANGFCKIGSYIARLEPEPFALAQKDRMYR